MYSFWQTHRRKIVAFVLVAMPFVLLATSAGADQAGHPGVGRRATSTAFGWVQSGGAHVVATAGAWLGDLFRGDVAAKNEELEARVARLEEEKARLIGVLQENERLRELVGFKRAHDEFDLVPARVVARDITPYFRVLKVRISSDAKLEPRMPVVVADGVVGQVAEVDGDFADVIVVSDPRSHIDAISQRTRAHGIVEGLGHERDYLCRVAYLREKDMVRQGDLIVTSGMGGVFPADLVIGRVADVERRQRQLFQEVRVEPSVDFSRIEEVFVIRGKS